MYKTYKKLPSLVYALSPLNPLTARVLMKIILMLMRQVCRAPHRFLAPGTQTEDKD